MVFQPIALEQQARELLRGGQYEPALGLAAACAAHGAPWVETAFAQAALLLLNGRLHKWLDFCNVLWSSAERA